MVKFSLEKQKSGSSEAVRPWYDTRLGIMNALVSLKGLNQLSDERHVAGYTRNERLHEFYILGGRYHSDSCGNFSTVSGIPKDVPHSAIPSVLTKDEFFEFLKKNSKEKEPMISCAMNGGDLPEADIFCQHCKTGWTIDSCHDVVVWHNTEVFPLVEFVGRTLGEVKLAYEMRSDAVYRMQPDILIRNDKHIDLTPKLDYPTLKKNERGWLRERDGITDDYVIQDGDEGHFNVWKFYHKKCNQKQLETDEQKQFREIFEKAGFKVVGMKALLNQYCPCEHCPPWFDVETDFGVIRIGWRKRVINIDWSKLTGKYYEIPMLFQKEDVTKGPDGIHAWGWEKAQNYLTRIHKHLKN